MINYLKTIVLDKPDYVGKKLLLIDKLKDKLFRTDDQRYIEIEIDKTGYLFVYMVSESMIKHKMEYSLRKIGEIFLGLNNPSVTQILNYFVLPEMEIERIFNNLRYKYLKAIQLSKFINPNKFISYEYNRSFQSLANINVYQGNKKNRKPNDSFWKDAGFSETAKNNINFDVERKELSFIISYIRKLDIINFNKIYAELIAIKPGFHELFIHKDYFDKIPVPKSKEIRSIVFGLLRGIGKLSNLNLDKLNSYEINRKNYFTYASCNITEGPFVFRKKISVSYFDEISKIRTKDNLNKLNEKFYYLDYYNCNLETLEKFNIFLLKAKKFRYFM